MTFIIKNNLELLPCYENKEILSESVEDMIFEKWKNPQSCLTDEGDFSLPNSQIGHKFIENDR